MKAETEQSRNCTTAAGQPEIREIPTEYEAIEPIIAATEEQGDSNVYADTPVSEDNTSKREAIKRVSQLFLQEYGRNPTAEEIADVMGISEEEVKSNYEIPQENVSADEEIMKCLSFVFGQGQDNLEAEKGMRSSILKEFLEFDFSPRQQKVLALRFGIMDGKIRTIEEVSNELDVSTERIQQLERIFKSKLYYAFRRRSVFRKFFLDLEDNN